MYRKAHLQQGHKAQESHPCSCSAVGIDDERTDTEQGWHRTTRTATGTCRLSLPFGSHWLKSMQARTQGLTHHSWLPRIVFVTFPTKLGMITEQSNERSWVRVGRAAVWEGTP